MQETNQGIRQDCDGNQNAAIAAMMPLLETMMVANEGVAGYLMGRLYPIAARSYSHHIRDAIELWMEHSTSVELADNLTRLVNEGWGSKMRKHYEGWAAKIRESSKRAKPR